MLQLKVVLAKQNIVSIAQIGVEQHRAIEVVPRFEDQSGNLISPSELLTQNKDFSWEHVDKVVASYVSAALHCNNISENEVLFIKISKETMLDDTVFEQWIRIFSDSMTQLKNKMITVLSACTDKAIIAKRWEGLRALNIELGIYGFDCNANINALDLVQSFDWDWAKFKIATKEEFNEFEAIEYCRKNNIRIVVESVENKGQEALASIMGADLVQGYLYDKPKPFYLETNLKHVES